MKLTKLLVATTLTIASTFAFATPQYNGNTSATSITGNEMGSGYYIWSDETDSANWHIRWSSTGSNNNQNVDWFGSVVFEGGGLTSAFDFSFEGAGDTYSTSSSFNGDELEWNTLTNDSGGVDGVDFRIAYDLNLMEFNLGSSLFAGMDNAHSDPGVTGSNIFIGDGFDTPDVLVFTNAKTGQTYQSFEVNVAEPGTLALLGLGLAGLGFARRKQADA